MKKFMFLAMAVMGATTACSTSEKQIAEALKKNPQLVFEVIEENPDKFIEVVNRAARKAQEGQQQKRASEAQALQQEQLKNPLQPVLAEKRLLYGRKTAPITIVEYADFQCPACRMAYASLKQIKEKYKDNIQVYYKNMPLDFHKMAYPSALYFEGIFQQSPAKAQLFYEHLFENQDQLNDDFLKTTAKKVGADTALLAKAIQSKEVKDRIQSDMNEFEKLGFTGTPVIVVNGVAMPGAQSVAEIERVIALTNKK